MKRFPRPLALLVAAAGLTVCAQAATYQWDVNGAAAGLGGDGTWDITSLYWDLLGSGDGAPIDTGLDTTTAATFVADDIAIFGGTAGTVNIAAGGVTLGTIQIDTAGYILNGPGAITLAGTTPGFAVNANATVNAVITGAAGLLKTGAGTLTLTAANTYVGGTTINGGTLQIGTNASSGTLGTGAVVNNGALIFNRYDNVTVSENISGTGSITKTGAGVLTLGGTNTATGAKVVNIQQGTLKLGSATGIADGSNVTVSNGATFDFGGQGNSTTRNFNFSIAGSGVNGQGAMTNSSGTLIYGNSSIGSVTLTGNTSLGGVGRWDIGDGSAGRTFNGGGFTLTKVGTNQIVFRPDNTAINLAAINVNQGTWTYEGFSRTTADTTGMTNTVADGATLDSYGTLSFNMPLVFNGNSSLTNGNGTATWTGGVTINGTLNVNSGNAINLQGVLSGAGALIKSSGGTLTLSNTGTYTGGTRINGGTLALTHATDTLANTGAVTINGGTLSLGANSDTVGAVTFNSGALTGTGTLTGASFLADTAGNTTVSALLGGTTGLTKQGTGTLTINSAAAQPLTGGMRVNRGTLLLDNANLATPTDLIAGTNALTLGGGTLNVKGKTGAFATSQTFAGTTLNAGASTITTQLNTGTSNTINLGAVTRNAGATLNITATTALSTTASTTEVVKLSSLTYNGTAVALPGAGLTKYAGAGFFANSGTATRYAQINEFGQFLQAPAASAWVTTGGDAATVYNGSTASTLTGATTMYAALFNSGTAITHALGSNNLTTNGLLNIAAGTVTISGAGSLLVGAEKDLVIHAASTGGFTVSSVIANNAGGASSLTFNGAGGGVLTLNNITAANTYSGGTHINQGILSIGTGGTAANTARVDALGSGTVNVNAGGTLRLWIKNDAAFTIANNLTVNGGTILNEDGNHTMSGTVTVGAMGATMTSKYVGKNLTFSNTISGAGPVTVSSGANGDTQIILTSNASYTGGTTVSSGILTLQGNGNTGVGTIRGTVNVSAGAQLRLNAADVTGYGGGATALTTINLNGATNLSSTGTLHVATVVGSTGNQTLGAATINMTGASITGVAGANIDFHNPGSGNAALNTLASGTTSTISGTSLTLRQTGGVTFTVADGGAAVDLDVQSVITNGVYGAQALTKAGAGTMQLTGANNYSGATLINAGTLQIGGNGTTGNLGTGAVTVATGATLTFNRSDAMTVANAIGGAGAIVKNAAGSVTLSGNNTHTGSITVNTGRLYLTGTNTASLITVNSGGALGGGGSSTGNVDFAGGSTLRLNGTTPSSGLTIGGAVNFAGATAIAFDAAPVTGSHVVVDYGTLVQPNLDNLSVGGVRGSLVNDTLNTRILLNLTTASRTWNRTTAGNWDNYATASWLEGDALFSPGDAVTFDNTATNGAVTLVGTLYPTSITVNNSTTDYTFGGTGIIAGSSSITKSGTGTLTLNSGNTFTGKTTINGGVVAIAADSALGTVPLAAVADQLTINGGTLRITAGNQTLAANRGITLGAGGATFDTDALSDTSNNTTTVNGKITGTGNLTFKSNGDQSAGGGGSGTLGIDLQNAANDFTGTITVTSGLLAYGSNAALGNAANKIVLNGGGLIDPNRNITMTHEVEVVGTGNTIRTYGATTANFDGKFGGSGTVNRTDGGTLNLRGDLSGFSGTFVNQLGTTNITATNTIIGGAWQVTAGDLIFTSSADITLSGAVSSVGNTAQASFYKRGSGTLTLTGDNSAFLGNGANNARWMIEGGVLSVSNIADSGTGSQLGNWTSGNLNHISVSGGTLRYTGSANATTGRNLWMNTASGTIEVTDASATLAINGTGGTLSQRLVKTGAGTLAIAAPITTGNGAVTVSAGTLNLTGANTYTGTTLINGGTLLLEGATGTITGATATTIATGATLRIDNSTNNLGDRFGTGTITLDGGTLNYLHDGDAGVSYSETFGTLTVAGVGSTVATSRAAAGQTSTVTFANLTYTGGSVNFTGAGLGATVDTTNEIRFTADPKSNGIIGVWATVNGTDLATTTGPNNSLVTYTGGYTDIDARGASTIPDGATGHIRIVGDGTSGNVALGGATTTTIGSLSMTNANFASTVDTAGKTLATGGILIASGAEALTIGTAANSGTLTAATAGGTLVLNNQSASKTMTVNAVIANNTSASGLSKVGPGTVVLTGTNTFTGAVSISGGKVVTSSAANLGATSTVLNMSGGATLQATETYTLGRRISLGAGGASVEVDATKTLSHSNGFTGGNTLTKTGAGTLTFSGYGGGGFSGNLIINGGTVRFNTGLFNTNIGLSSITVNNGGTLLSPGGVGHSLGGYVSATPALTINSGGTYQVDQEQYLSTINLNGGQITGSAEIRTDNNWSFTVTDNSSMSARINGVQTAVNINVSSGKTFAMSGQITNSQPLVKSGAGTLTLTATNTYTGVTTVNAGKLLVNGAGSLAAGSAVSVNNAGTVLGGTGTVNGAITVASGAILQGGAGAVAETLTANGNVTLQTGSIIQLAVGAGGAHSTLARTGTGTWTFDANQKFSLIDAGAVAGTTYTGLITGLAADPTTTSTWSLTNAGWAGNFVYNAGAIDFTLTAIPEPSVYGLVGAGALALVAQVRRRRRTAK